MATRPVVDPRTHDDRSRIQRIRQGDARALDALVLEYGTELCDFVYGIVQSRAIAEEVVQDLFCHLWDERDTWTVTGTVAGYLFGAARNRALNAARHQRVALAFARRLGRAAGPSAPAADQRVRVGELAECAERAIAALPERCRTVFVLQRSYGLTYRDIAEVMKLSPRTVEVHMGRALAALRKTLAPWLESE